jgi:quercetin dioxygenase-like cupin family protein
VTAAKDAGALDAMTAAADHHELLLENDQVRVLDTGLGPGERTPLHTHASSATPCVMSWSDFLRRDAEGSVIVDSRNWERQPAVGEALWLPPLTPHSVENVGGSELRLIAVELKSG